jgi:hypothetical protein
MGTSCAGVSTATVGGTTSLKKDNAAGANGTASQYVAKQNANIDPNNPIGFGITPPPDAPDFTSMALKQRRAAQSLQLLSGRGRAQSFLGGYASGPGALSSGSTGT